MTLSSDLLFYNIKELDILRITSFVMAFIKRQSKKSPLKSNPLRNPGQSLDETINSIIFEEGMDYLFFFVISIFFVLWNSLLLFEVIDISITLYASSVAIGLSIYCLLKLLHIKKKIKNLRLGRDGERAVGQTLDALKNNGYKVYHDIIGENFNIDHLIVCKYGIFSIETKTYSKPNQGECKILVKHNGIYINGYLQKKNIFIQAKAQQSWLESLLCTLTGLKVHVQPVVVFPGWYVENHIKGHDIWVLEPKALPSFIKKRPVILTTEQINFISNQLSRYIRTTYTNRF
ncbi:MAG: NERD domain-containing protein [Gammaproteobacteria bacterium]|nr:NERD domain-containing protein [Gammaproteobacteria bacterium]